MDGMMLSKSSRRSWRIPWSQVLKPYPHWWVLAARWTWGDFFLGEVPDMERRGMPIGMITRIVKWIVSIINHLQATVWRRAVAFGSIENEVLLNCMTTAYQKGDQWVQVHWVFAVFFPLCCLSFNDFWCLHVFRFWSFGRWFREALTHCHSLNAFSSLIGGCSEWSQAYSYLVDMRYRSIRADNVAHSSIRGPLLSRSVSSFCIWWPSGTFPYFFDRFLLLVLKNYAGYL